MGTSCEEHMLTSTAKNRVWGLFELMLRNIALYDVDEQDEEGNSTLHILITQDKPTYFKELLKKGANLYLKNKNRETPLDVACREGNLEIVKTLVQAKCDINGEPSIYKAVKNGKLEVVEFLLRNGAAISENDALHASVESDQSEILDFVLNRKKVDVDVLNSSGYSALQVAVKNGFTRTAEVLVRHGADVKILDYKKRTLLHVAILNKKSHTARFLIAIGCDVNAQDEEGSTPLHSAAECGLITMILPLLEASADSNIQDRDGYLPLHVLVRNRKFNIILSDVLAGVTDIDSKNANGDTALHCALTSGNEIAAKILVKNGAHANVRNN